MKTPDWKLGKTYCAHACKDPYLSSTGGDYSYYETPVFRNGIKVGVLHSSSAAFAMCQVSGRFESDRISIHTPVGELAVADHLWPIPEDTLSDEEFLALLSQYKK